MTDMINTKFISGLTAVLVHDDLSVNDSMLPKEDQLAGRRDLGAMGLHHPMQQLRLRGAKMRGKAAVFFLQRRVVQQS